MLPSVAPLTWELVQYNWGCNRCTFAAILVTDSQQSSDLTLLEREEMMGRRYLFVSFHISSPWASTDKSERDPISCYEAFFCCFFVFYFLVGWWWLWFNWSTYGIFSISLAHDRTNSKWLFSSQMLLLLSSCWLSAPGQSLSCSYWFLPVGVTKKTQLQNHGEIAADQVSNNNNGVCMKHCESLNCSLCSLWPSNVVLIK